MKIETRNATGEVNGYVLPIWNGRESPYRPDQVYLTVVNPGCSKGPHLHKHRHGFFACIQGSIEIVTRTEGEYAIHHLGELRAGVPLLVRAGTACEIRNAGDVPAYVLNMPSPGWSVDEPDENEVADWTP